MDEIFDDSEIHPLMSNDRREDARLKVKTWPKRWVDAKWRYVPQLSWLTSGTLEELLSDISHVSYLAVAEGLHDEAKKGTHDRKHGIGRVRSRIQVVTERLTRAALEDAAGSKGDHSLTDWERQYHGMELE